MRRDDTTTRQGGWTRRGRRFGLVLTACVLGAGLVSAPGSAAPVPEPDAMAVRIGCIGGPGRLNFEVTRPDADGMAAATVSTRKMTAGSRWSGLVFAIDSEGEPLDEVQFRRTAAGGRWTIDLDLDVSEAAAGPVFYDAFAFERGPGLCGTEVLNGRGRTFGIGFCSPRIIHALAAKRTDDGLLLRYLQDAVPDSVWRLEFRVIGLGGSESVVVDDRANRNGFLTTTVELEGGMPNPWLFVEAESQQGRRCGIGLNPRNDTVTALPSVRDLVDATRALRERARSLNGR